MKSILVQLDTDAHPSVFDRVVAVDAGVEYLFSYGGVTPESVTGLVHGAMFTRGSADLKNTAVFVGGSRVGAGEQVAAAVRKAFFGPLRVSVMMDSNGCNTTAAAAVALARKTLPLAGQAAVVLGGTGPVGLRVAELLATEQAHVTLVSRTADRAATACNDIRTRLPEALLTPAAATIPAEFEQVCSTAAVVIAAGAAGVCFLEAGALARLPALQLAIDLNAVLPVGIADISPMDKAVSKGPVTVYGALGAGGLKMKVHKRAICSLFESNDRILDTQPIYRIALDVAGLSG
jgi:hypothetical protein